MMLLPFFASSTSLTLLHFFKFSLPFYSFQDCPFELGSCFSSRSPPGLSLPSQSRWGRGKFAAKEASEASLLLWGLLISLMRSFPPDLQAVSCWMFVSWLCPFAFVSDFHFWTVLIIFHPSEWMAHFRPVLRQVDSMLLIHSALAILGSNPF